MVSIVNGYVCFNCTDVANAKKGINPAHPKDPLHPQTDAQNALAAAKAKDNPAVILSGALSNSSTANGTANSSAATNSSSATQNPTPASYSTGTGTQVDVSA
jgi:hypothetical protein